MSRFMDDHIIEEIRERSDIVEIVSQYVSLKPTGKNYKALCPFHNEKTPSFVVNPERKIFHCFGCGSGGNVFGFLMKMEGISFPEAVELLARRYGLEPSSASHSSPEREKRDSLYQVNQLAAHYFSQKLWDQEIGKGARAYLCKRDLSGEVAQQFQLGYAPDEWEGLLRFLVRQGVSPEIAQEAGLVIRTESGRYHDLFRGRIILPIFDLSGRIIGFGGRSIEEVEGRPKYINTPETLIYKKSRSLYGLNLAREAIRREGLVYIVEGYFDLISLMGRGICNAVATLGTALTEEHLHILRRYTQRIVMVYDADPAGKMALLRKALPIIEGDLRAFVLPLPKGEDPDSFIRRYGKEAFLQRRGAVIPYIQYIIDIILAEKGFSSLEQRLDSLDILIPLLAKVANRVEQMNYLSYLADKMGIPAQVLLSEVRRRQSPPSRSLMKGREAIDFATVKADRQLAAERELLRIMVREPELLSSIQHIITAYNFKDPDLEEIMKTSLRLYTQGYKDQRLWDKTLEALTQDRQRSLLTEFLLETIEYEDKRKALEDCLRIITRGVHRTDATTLEHMYWKAIQTENYDDYNLLQKRYIECFR